MSLLLKVKKVKLDEDMIMVIDMKAITIFKELTGQSFLQAIKKIADMDESLILALIASSLRYSLEDEPVGMEFLNKYNPLALITELTEPLIDLIESAMPKPKAGDVKKKRVVKK